jgi:hypothetical protein
MKLSAVLANAALIASSVVYADVDPIVIKVSFIPNGAYLIPIHGDVRTDPYRISGFKILLQV